MRDMTFRSLAPLILVATACTAPPESRTPSEAPAPPPVAARLAVAPPVLAPDAHLRFTTTPTNEVQAEDVATGTVRWTLSARIPAAAPATRWRIVFSDDGTSIYVQALSDERGLTYLGTRRIETRTGVELANDIKYEIYWYENVVLWTAFTQGVLEIAIERAPAGGGGYWLRTFDPLTLKMLTNIPKATPPVAPP